MKSLYMIVIEPPAILRDKIERIRSEFAESYNCKAGLKNPVHVTLIPPFNEDDDYEEELKSIIKSWAAKQKTFDLTIKGFDTFRKNGVIFLSVVPNKELKELHKGLATQLTRFLQPILKTNQPYHPHITIGYKDIPKDLFEQAVKDYMPRKFEEHFIVESLSFWKHEGKSWNTIASLPLEREDNSIRQPSLF
jgi:2'-5' RNA ligase